jgi:hypothetical protein
LRNKKGKKKLTREEKRSKVELVNRCEMLFDAGFYLGSEVKPTKQAEEVK